MDEEKKIMKWAAIFFALVAVAAGGWYILRPSKASVSQEENVLNIIDGGIVAVDLPKALGETEQIGKAAFDAVCSACHGPNGQERKDIAPLLIHKIYKLGHHGDMAFVLAAKNGVGAHRCDFGILPAVNGITQTEVLNIVS